jgi:hypothetical protein
MAISKIGANGLQKKWVWFQKQTKFVSNMLIKFFSSFLNNCLKKTNSKKLF